MAPTGITEQQIKAAERMREQMLVWKATDQTFQRLACRYPEPSDEFEKKARAINSYYGTRVTPDERKRIENAISRLDGPLRQSLTPAREIEELAASVNTLSGAKLQLSFMSKFAHFFIDQFRYYILDENGERGLRLHFGGRFPRGGAYRYETFYDRIQSVLSESSCPPSPPEVDRYLWLRGLLSRLDQHDDAINHEARMVFEDPTNVEILNKLRGQ